MIRHNLFENIPVKFSTLDNIRLGAGKISPNYFRRLYRDSILGNIWLYTLPKIDLMKRDMPLFLSASVEGELLAYRFHVHIVKRDNNILTSDRYVGIFFDPIEIVASVYNNTTQVVPPLGIEAQIPWVGLLDSIPNFDLIGYARNEMTRILEEKKKFSPESIKKASILLHKIALLHGFQVYDDHIEKESIIINRQDCSFWINDQVLQKLLALSNPKALDNITTLKKVIKSLLLKL